MYIGCFDYDLDARCVLRNFYGWYMNKVSFLFKLWKTWTTTKNHFSHHKSFPERHELLQFSPRASQISSLSHCCDLKTHKEGWCLRRCTRYPAYLYSDWDVFVSFEKEKVRDRRFSEVVLPILLSFKSLLATKGARNPLLDKLYFVQLCWYLD